MPGSPRDSILVAATLPTRPTISSTFSRSIAGQGRHYLGAGVPRVLQKKGKLKMFLPFWLAPLFVEALAPISL